MKQCEQPALTMSFSISFNEIGFGVVCVELNESEPTLLITVEISPQVNPSLEYKSWSKVAVVVLPFVPVIPTRFSFFDG